MLLFSVAGRLQSVQHRVSERGDEYRVDEQGGAAGRRAAAQEPR